MWDELSENRKKVYYEKEKKDKERFKNQMD